MPSTDVIDLTFSEHSLRGTDFVQATQDLPSLGTEPIPSPLHREPFFSYMSTFLDLDPEALEPFCTSLQDGTGGATQNNSAHEFQFSVQDELRSFFSPGNTTW